LSKFEELNAKKKTRATWHDLNMIEGSWILCYWIIQFQGNSTARWDLKMHLVWFACNFKIFMNLGLKYSWLVPFCFPYYVKVQSGEKTFGCWQLKNNSQCWCRKLKPDAWIFWGLQQHINNITQVEKLPLVIEEQKSMAYKVLSLFYPPPENTIHPSNIFMCCIQASTHSNSDFV